MFLQEKMDFQSSISSMATFFGNDDDDEGGGDYFNALPEPLETWNTLEHGFIKTDHASIGIKEGATVKQNGFQENDFFGYDGKLY
ncbi:hypothetical protein L596_029947 [Steinernema carpocapsae]|uniref:Uncharacterized protein n=1 Tax=Steinernema carpocapsae TaxID=34508 RepID=A0A4U5LRA2_STECR|nr:hypothetical protein L596_029947 [Steinernema carpocapsae]